MITLLFAMMSFFGAMGLIASLGGSHDELTTLKIFWSVAFLLVGWAGIAVEFAKAIF